MEFTSLHMNCENVKDAYFEKMSATPYFATILNVNALLLLEKYFVS